MVNLKILTKFLDTTRKKRFSKDIVHYTFLRLKKNYFKYEKYICEFQKKLIKLKKNYPHNKKYFDLTRKKNFFNYEKIILSSKTLI